MDTLKKYMIDSVDVVLFSKRRYGKSSLIKEIFKNHINNDKYLTIYFDIFDISSASDFAYSFYKAVAKSFQTDIKTILQTLKELFSKTTFSATVTKEFKPTISTLPFEEMIEDIFLNTQKTALKTIVKNSGKNLLSKEILASQNISKSSLASALNVLYEKEIIDKNSDIYYINDKLFELWLK